MEFRIYDKLNCSEFDLISGYLEPKQTKALGYLLAKSKVAMSIFIKLINRKIHYDTYIVDCEAQNVDGRIDILLRFYLQQKPIVAFIIEAKSENVNTNASVARNQVQKYSIGFKQLADFKKIELITITRESEVTIINSILSISWSQLIIALSKVCQLDKLIFNFINYIINASRNMNYYEEEILAIPAGKSLPIISTTGIYECPENYATHKKSLYITFKDKKGGDMKILYKLTEKYVFDINDNSAIDVINNTVPDFRARFAAYKNQIGYPLNGVKQVYVLDIENPIVLPNIVRPMENNASPAYYSLCDFFSRPNSNKGNVIVQKSITINNDKLTIKTQGKKFYELYDSKGIMLVQFITTGVYDLNNQENYVIKVEGANKSVALKEIDINCQNNLWGLYFKF